MNMGEVETKVVNCVLDCTEDSSKSRCDELEERSKKAEARVLQLEKEIDKRKKEYEELQAKFRELEAQNKSVEAELETFRTGNNEITRHANSLEDKSKVDLTGEADRENSIVLMSIKDLPASATPYKDTPLAGREGTCSNFKVKYHREVRKGLSFDDEKSPSKKIAPSTPGTRVPTNFNVIDIFDSEDDESDIHVSTEHVLAETKKDEICLEDYEEDVDESRDKIPSILTSKRKRVAKMVTSDTESDEEEDDNVPIAKLIKTRNPEKISKVESSDVIGNDRFSPSHSRRRLVSLRKCEEKATKPEQVSPNEESEEVGSESEGESLGGFIVNSSDSSSVHHHEVPSHSENGSDGGSSAHDVSGQSENESDGFDEILSKLERSKDRKWKWEFEGDMLSAFGKDLELCMKAVCALYRQQTCDEQVSKEAKYGNGRGFSKFDALRGSELAEFLMDGDPEGDLKKSKKELEEFGSSAVELCRTLATRYSKQLFEIYKNKEDPLFIPS